jgi:hypothetical protein
MRNFKSWIDINEGLIGYAVADLFALITEAQAKTARKPKKAAPQAPAGQRNLFGDVEEKPEVEYPKGEVEPEEGGSCPVTPLSSYAKHIKSIQAYAHDGNPDHFAQVMMFSPLSAHAKFPEHWDHFLVLMFILKHYFPKQIDDRSKLRYVLDSFDDKYHSLKSTINGFKFDTIVDIWNNRENLMQELNSIAAQGDDAALINRLVQIKGVAPVKAGFMVQLLWGRAGCIDVHNVAIYRAVFPDLANKIRDEEAWTKKSKDVEEYVKLLKTLQGRGIGTQQLWDVWVNFVDSMYKMIANEGRGVYGDYGPSLDPNDPEYGELKGKTINKSGIGGQEKGVDVPIVGGVGGKVGGAGASATHLQMDPDAAMKDLYKMYRLSQYGKEPSGSIIYPTRGGKPLDPQLGLGVEPSLLHYFSPAMSSTGEVDPEHARRLVADRAQKVGKLQQKDLQRAAFEKRFGPVQKSKQGKLFK